MEKLEPLEIPLTGSTLIEASAGTGKTYTITTLFLRLLIEKKLAVDRILVVTFTIAATEELRIKIRERISVAIDILNGLDAEDEALSELLSRHEKQQTLELLGDVAARLDELAVFTIDAMCLKVLKDFAFESKLPMRMDFIANDDHIKKLVAEDYWRSAIGSKDYLAVDELSNYGSPGGLLKNLMPVLRMRDANIEPQITRSEAEQLRRALNKQYFKIASFWEDDQVELTAVLRNEKKSLKGNMYQQKSVEKLLEQLNPLFAAERFPAALPVKFNLVTAEYLQKALRKNQQPPEHMFFDLCGEFLRSFVKLNSLRRAVVLIEARDYILAGVDRYKRERGFLHFEDLRIRLCDALQSQNGQSLINNIRELWPYAMIDESQDTDPQQNSIFQSVYKNQPECGLFYIGDPKQAIYSFRGADVFTYMNAARSFDRRYTLGVNWRSSERLVRASNALFTFKPAPFVFDKDITYSAVSAAGRADGTCMTIATENVAPFQFRLPMDADGGNQQSIAARGCALEIARLLSNSAEGAAMLGDVPLQASDIAVLVRSHTQGSAIQHALRRVGVKSASTTSESVFASAQAKQLLSILSAISQPRASAIRRSLVTDIIGYTAQEINSINQNEQAWDNLINDFYSYRDIWLGKGLMAAVQSLFVDKQVARRVLVSPGGERHFTNLVQLTELLQIRSREMSSTDELVSWFEQQIEYPSTDDDQLLRLESDESLVQIVTIHKSKGLEYPVVFIPFGWTIGLQQRKSPPGIVTLHERSDYSCTIDLGSDNKRQNHLLAEEEELSESLRLLYVAITRAKYLCVIGFEAVTKGAYPALGYLLSRDSTQRDMSKLKLPKQDEINSDLAAFAESLPDCISVAPWSDEGSAVSANTTEATLARAEFTGKIDRTWRITSYTGLQSGEDSGLPDRDYLYSGNPEIPQGEVDQLGAIARLPAGARTGQLLHELYEVTDFTDSADLRDDINGIVSRYGSFGGAEDWSVVIEEIYKNSIDSVLDQQSGLALRDLPKSDRVDEMEFFFSLNNASAAALRSVLTQYPQYVEAAAGLNFRDLNGLMRGFIDMVGRVDGKYFIVDYKSNLLGASRQHYHSEQLSYAIRSHRYDLQYLIYTVALHRYLQSRIGLRYNYETHFLGVFYLFIRGMKPGSSAGIWHDKPPYELVEQLDRCFDAELV